MFLFFDFVVDSQQDAQEFLRFLLEGLHDDLNDVKSKPKYTQCEFPDSFRYVSHVQAVVKNISLLLFF